MLDWPVAELAELLCQRTPAAREAVRGLAPRLVHAARPQRQHVDEGRGRRVEQVLVANHAVENGLLVTVFRSTISVTRGLGAVYMYHQRQRKQVCAGRSRYRSFD